MIDVATAALFIPESLVPLLDQHAIFYRALSGA